MAAFISSPQFVGQQGGGLYERIHTASVGLPVAFTRTSVRCPTANVMWSVSYGWISTKSFAVTCIMWPSMVIFWTAAADGLMKRSLQVFPDVKLKVAKGALGVQGKDVFEQSKSFSPLMRLLLDMGMLATGRGRSSASNTVS